MNIARGYYYYFCLLFLLLFCLSLPYIAIAQQTQSSDRAGLAVSPSVFEEQLDPGEVLSFSLKIDNKEDRERTLYLRPRNISGVQSGGVPIFAEEGDELTGYELADWISFSREELSISANGTETVEVTLNVPENAPPGSHFGGVNITSQAPQLRESGAGVAYGVTNIVTIRVSGEADERSMIRSFSTDRYIHGQTNVVFSARVENPGNVLQRPVGPVEVRNMFGAGVARLTMNESRASVFPGTEREFTVRWQDENPGFGRYEAVLSMVYGSEGINKTMTNTVTFWILPMSIITPALIVLAVILAITFIGVRIYIKRALRYHTGKSSGKLKRTHAPAPMPFWLLATIIMLSVTAIFLIILLALFA